MNKINIEKQAIIISTLVEGASIRSVERITGVHRDTITRLMVRVGQACQKLMDEKMRNLTCKNIQMNEIWCFVGKKQRHVRDTDNPYECGNFWTWVAIDSDSKLVPTYKVGKRDYFTAQEFICDLSSRLSNRVQLSTDRLRHYIDAIEMGFGTNVDYGQIVKSYEAEPVGPGRYGPPKVVSADKKQIFGNPNPYKISTSYVERQNLTMRMSMRRFTRLTNAFSKKLENLKATVALHYTHYNFARVHRSLRITPAMAAGVSNHIWDMEEIIGLAE